MTFADPIDFYHAVKKCWSQDSIADVFDPENPCRNQCAVTALALRHFFGGEIIKTRTKGGTHFYNQIDGKYWDMATDQFDEPIPYENIISSVDEAHQHASLAHFSALLDNIEAHS